MTHEEHMLQAAYNQRRQIEWYLMRALHINDTAICTVGNIAKEEPNTTILVVTTGVKNKFIVTGSDGWQVGQKATWIYDTGCGYKSAPFGEDVMTILNVIEMVGGKVISQMNTIGIDGMRSERALPTLVFK